LGEIRDPSWTPLLCVLEQIMSGSRKRPDGIMGMRGEGT